MAEPRVSRLWRVLAAVALVLAALMVPVYARYHRAVVAAYARAAAGARLARTPCGPIEYAVAGEGPPVLVVHGAGGGFDQGLELGASFARGGFRIIAVSRFGYLGTPLPADPGANAQADAHACLLDALGIRRAAIAGISAGGPSALAFAVRHPERTAALVLLVPAVYAPRPGGAPAVRSPRGTLFLFETALRSDFLFWAARYLAPQAFIRSILGTPPALVAAAAPAEQARLQETLDRILPVRPRRLGLLNDAAVVSALTRYPLEAITAPTLAISTTDDLYGTYEGARYTAAEIPHARFIGYPSGGHMLVGRDAGAEIAAFLRTEARF
jgi:2-hydroxy-6-oxonona-2,4-dienedioate hydrolase